MEATAHREPTSGSITETGPTVGRYLRWLVASFSLTAAAIHFGFAPAHLQEDWAHGWFFLITGWLGATFAVLIVTRPRRWLWAMGLLLNLGIFSTWVVSRTAGLPFGPQALRKEGVSTPDLVCSVLEALVVLAAAAALLAPKLLERPLRNRRLMPAASLALIAAVVGVGSVSLTPAYSGEHTHAAGGHTHSAAEGTVISSALTGNTPCEQSGPPASPGQAQTDAEGHNHRGPTVQDPLTEAERETLKTQQAQARAVALQYPTVADAEKAGYHMSTVYVPCIGAHYTNIGLVMGFDPAKPSELLYDGTKPDSKIVGLSYLSYHPGGPPEGFAGPNDRWHQHNVNGGLCFKDGVVAGGEAMTPDECIAIGGKKRELTDIWMVHDWIVPGWECSWGAFAGECPELGGRTGGSAWDAPDPSVTDPVAQQSATP